MTKENTDRMVTLTRDIERNLEELRARMQQAGMLTGTLEAVVIKTMRKVTDAVIEEVRK
jgi:hypothetical protein